MRTRSLLKLACVGLLLSGCADDEAEAEPTASAAATPTSLVVVLNSAASSPVIDASVFVDDCVAYVPVAAFLGNPYMQIIWAMANQNPTDLRTVCQGMVATDPQGLQRMSEEKAALDAAPAATAPVVAPASATTVPPPTMPINPPPTVAGAPAPVPAGPMCAEGQVLGASGFCEAATP